MSQKPIIEPRTGVSGGQGTDNRPKEAKIHPAWIVAAILSVLALILIFV